MLKLRHAIGLVVAIVVLQAASSRATEKKAEDTCLMFVTRNISNPGPNYFLYYAFSNRRVDIRKGDLLEYDIYLGKSNPEPCGGIDIETLEGNLPIPARSIRIISQSIQARASNQQLVTGITGRFRWINLLATLAAVDHWRRR